ncbi:MAG: molybdopterin cofactor-binding domain-containing protein [Chitinophagaceae bacterium]
MINSRRHFIKNMGCLTIGFSMAGYLSKQGSYLVRATFNDIETIDTWLKVLADGRVRVYTGKLELGQGIRTAIAQVAAEELELEMASVEVVLAETGVTPNEGYTAGSGSIENSAMAVRNAAAAARQQLLELASVKLKTPAAQLIMFGGKISVKGRERSLTFNEVLDDRQLTGEVRLPVTVKQKNNYRLVGKAIPREDIIHMVKAEQVYVQDLRFPGMVHARIVRPPAYGAKLKALDLDAVKKKFPGLLKVVRNGSFLGIIDADEYTVVKAQTWLHENTQWSDAPQLPEDINLVDLFKTLPSELKNVRKKGNLESDASATVSLKSSYFKPYIMHGSIGPSCAVALFKDNKLDVWTHSQGVYPLKGALQKLLQMSEGNIHIKGVPGSGCYGHNGADDVAADAALLAVAFPGKHVRLQWSREDEHAWEPYGSAMILELSARMDATGKISDWQHNMWSDSHGNRPGGNPENLLAAKDLEKPFNSKATGFSGGAYRNSEPYYTIPNQQVDIHFVDGPLRVSSLRSLGAYGNIFAIESFMDELAEKAGKDPYEFRLKHLDDERAIAAIRKLQSITSGQKSIPHYGMGIAFSRYKNSGAYCATAALVSVDPSDGAVRVRKMWSVIDAGEVINPDGIINQTEGGMIQSASWTLKEQVLFDKKQVTSRNWNNYPIFRFSDVPEVEVALIDRPDKEALGAGEAAQGPAAAAIVNAIYRACGKRIRNLPVGRIV